MSACGPRTVRKALLNCSPVMAPRFVTSNMPNIVRRSSSVKRGCVPCSLTPSRYLTMNCRGFSGL